MAPSEQKLLKSTSAKTYRDWLVLQNNHGSRSRWLMFCCEGDFGNHDEFCRMRCSYVEVSRTPSGEIPVVLIRLSLARSTTTDGYSDSDWRRDLVSRRPPKEQLVILWAGAALSTSFLEVMLHCTLGWCCLTLCFSGGAASTPPPRLCLSNWEARTTIRKEGGNGSITQGREAKTAPHKGRKG